MAGANSRTFSSSGAALSPRHRRGNFKPGAPESRRIGAAMLPCRAPALRPALARAT
jgi:hypothetical protein